MKEMKCSTSGDAGTSARIRSTASDSLSQESARIL